jgi:hypothetical protein
VWSDSEKKKFKETIQFSLLRKNDKVGLVWINSQAYPVAPLLYSVKSPLHELQHRVWEFSSCHQTNVSITLTIYPARIEPCYQIIDYKAKLSVLKPIFKNGDKLVTSNYRPISLLVSFSKVFVKLIYNSLYEHININSILGTEQYGFRPNTSTENASFKLTHEILSAVNNKCAVGSIFCDLEKASGCVNHNILLEKLQFYRIVGKFQALIKSYLSERYQKVFTDNTNSSNSAASSWKSNMGFCKAQFSVHCFFSYT